MARSHRSNYHQFFLMTISTILFALSLLSFWLIEWIPSKTFIHFPASIVDPSFRIHRNRYEGTSTAAEGTNYAGVFSTASSSSLSLYPSNYAYVWLIGGVHEDRLSYKGFLYDVFVSVHLLRKMNSTADFWLLVQLAPDSNLHWDNLNFSLPADDKDWQACKKMNIRVHVLKTPSQESFAQLVYEKFRPLQWSWYRRVIFLDADTIPLTNLDYLFHLSDPLHTQTPTILRPSLIVATRGEPCNTGFFMMEPTVTAWQELLDIMQKQRMESKDLPHPKFDFRSGWGHNFIQQGDQWEAVYKNGTTWRYHAGHSDQGLYYYYTKYHKKDVSMIIGNRLQNYFWNQDKGQIQIDNFINAFIPYAPIPLVTNHNCVYETDKSKKDGIYYMCEPVYRDYAHFMGSNKPWQKGVEMSFFKDNNDISDLHASHRLWFDELATISDQYGLDLDIPNWNKKYLSSMNQSPLGYIAKYADAYTAKLPSSPSFSSSSSENVESVLDTMAKNSSTWVISSDTVTLAPDEVVAYVIALIKCGDGHRNDPTGLSDASLVLRHSVHRISSRNPDSGSKYDYKMYALVHRDAEQCSDVLKNAGFNVLIVDSPVRQDEIRGEYLRKHIHRELCCGAPEFIKLYSYNLPHKIIVLSDIDFLFFKPMDDLFDSILYDKDSDEGKHARKNLLLERGNDTLPDRIDAFYTRDWPQVAPGKFPPGFQAGFLVIRRDPSVLEEMIEIVREGNYTNGWGYGYGWAGKGYAGYVGAMAMQGLVAYYYDYIRSNVGVELNQCRFNHMGMDTRYRMPPNFRPKLVPRVGDCRNGLSECEDCMFTATDKIFSIHYTMCRKPWQCMGEAGAHSINLVNGVDLEHCLKIIEMWHIVRLDFEKRLQNITSDDSVWLGTAGKYKVDIFKGHCNGEGTANYIPIAGRSSVLHHSHKLY